MTTLHSERSERVLVALSGGVDSAVAALLLKKQGYEVIGVHLQLANFKNENFSRTASRCCSLSDANDAQRVCDILDIPFYVLDMKEVFREAVMDYFVHEYLKSRTPNPCVQCNQKIKFHHLLMKAQELGCTKLATGHYAQIRKDPERGYYYLCKSEDSKKDQTYFLFGMTQEALHQTLFPLGNLKKDIVRKMAKEFGLPVSHKPDSQEICFVGKDGYARFIEKYSEKHFHQKGTLRTQDGMMVGEHTGLYQYTVGQRKGLRLNIQDQEPYYVIEMNSKSHTIIVGKEKDLYRKGLVATDAHWISPVNELGILRCKAKIRSQAPEMPCQVVCFENKTVHVVFDEAQRAITPGQAVVFYQGDHILGGGWIDSSFSSQKEKDSKKKITKRSIL